MPRHRTRSDAAVFDADGSDYTLRSGATVAAASDLIGEFLQLAMKAVTA